jgi:hypothetical protein
VRHNGASANVSDSLGLDAPLTGADGYDGYDASVVEEEQLPRKHQWPQP